MVDDGWGGGGGWAQEDGRWWPETGTRSLRSCWAMACAKEKVGPPGGVEEGPGREEWWEGTTTEYVEQFVIWPCHPCLTSSISLILIFCPWR